jgi:hypothetical protein
VAANRAPHAHREPVGQTVTMICVTARPNARCVCSYGILANRTLGICRSIRKCLGSSGNFSGRWSNRNRVKEVGEWKSHHERRRGPSSLNGLLMNTVGEFEKTHLVHHKPRHDGIARWRANEVDSATEKLVTTLDNTSKQICKFVLHITSSEHSV